MNKTMTALLVVLMAALALSGCAANASGTTATAAPIVTNSPMATMAPAASPAADAGITGTNDVNNAAGLTGSGTMDAAQGATGGSTGASASASPSMTPADAGRLAERIAEAVERISEIDDAEVVVSDDRVLVAVEFEDQYAAGLDDRMKDMITEAVQKVDDGLTNISITDDDTLYGQVKGLGERLAKATGFDELADDFGDLWDRITGM